MSRVKNEVSGIEKDPGFVTKRLTGISDFVDAPAGWVDRIMSRSLSSLERIQNLLELELLELDGISDEIEEAIGKKTRS